MDEWKNITELLAAESAIADAINNDLKRGKGTIRDVADAMAFDMYESTGAKSFDLNFNGKKVGTYSVTVKEECEESAIIVTNPVQLVLWCLANDCVENALVPDTKTLMSWFEATGELPEGCELTTCLSPKSVTGTRLSINKKFKEFVRQQLDEKVLRGARIAAFLNGGSDDE